MSLRRLLYELECFTFIQLERSKEMGFSVFSLLPADEVITLSCGIISSFVLVYLLMRQCAHRFRISHTPAAGFGVGQRLGSEVKSKATPH